MFKTIYPIALLFVSLTVQAQQANPFEANTPAQLAIRNHNTHTPQKTNAPGSRMVAKSQLMYNLATAQYDLLDSVHYQYSGNRGGDAESFIPGYDISISYTAVTGILVNNGHATAYYDANDNVVSRLDEIYSLSPGAFGTADSTKYFYDANHLLVCDSVYEMNMTTALWMPHAATTYTYSTTGKILAYNYFRYNDATNAWNPTPAVRETYAYDTDDNCTEITTVILGGGSSSFPSSRKAFTYSSTGQLTSSSYSEWDGTNWIPQSAVNYHLNALGETDTAIYRSRNMNTGLLDTTYKSWAIFDANHNATELIIQAYNTATHTFGNMSQQFYTYNSYNQKTSEYGNIWNSGGFWETINGSSKRVYYYETFFPTAVTQLKQQGGTLQLYPVPANNTLNLTINWDVAQAYTLTIADMQGRTVIQNNNSSSSIDVSALPTGAYNLILKGDKGGTQHSKFTIVR